MSSYTIAVPDEQISLLKAKLTHATFPDELEGSGYEYGAPLKDVRRLANYWLNGFDWRAQESKLSALPNFHKSIAVDGFGELDIHYVHQISNSPDAIPLLFVHGWPGSYIEVTKMLADLQQSSNGVAFTVVAPSLPNFGWSEGAKKTGFGLKQYAETLNKLMHSLGYTKYVTQGGDWGFYITRTLGLLYPTSVLASHINMIRAEPPTFTSHPIAALQNLLTPYNPRDHAGFARSNWFLTEGSGYRVIQGTKPQTPGYGLTDSPVGLLAWIYEKLHDWTDGYAWTDDEVLTWVSIYWFSTAGPAASLRIYYEAIHIGTSLSGGGRGGGVDRERTQRWIPNVKLGMCHTPREITVVPLSWGKTLGPVVYQDQKERGGHFAAWEIPREIIKDLRIMFGKGGPCYRITGRAKL